MISQFEDNKLHSPYGLVGLANLSKIYVSWFITNYTSKHYVSTYTNEAFSSDKYYTKH